MTDKLKKVTVAAVGFIYMFYLVILTYGFTPNNNQNARLLYYMVPFTMHFVGIAGHAIFNHLYPYYLTPVYPLGRKQNIVLASLDIILFIILMVASTNYFSKCKSSLSSTTIDLFMAIGILGCFGCFYKTYYGTNKDEMSNMSG